MSQQDEVGSGSTIYGFNSPTGDMAAVQQQPGTLPRVSMPGQQNLTPKAQQILLLQANLKQMQDELDTLQRDDQQVNMAEFPQQNQRLHQQQPTGLPGNLSQPATDPTADESLNALLRMMQKETNRMEFRPTIRFDGESIPFSEHLATVKMMMKIKSVYPEDHLRCLMSTLSGGVLNYLSQQPGSYKLTSSFDEAVAFIESHYPNRLTAKQKRLMVKELKQSPGETSVDFAARRIKKARELNLPEDATFYESIIDDLVNPDVQLEMELWFADETSINNLFLSKLRSVCSVLENKTPGTQSLRWSSRSQARNGNNSATEPDTSFLA